MCECVGVVGGGGRERRRYLMSCRRNLNIVETEGVNGRGFHCARKMK